MTTKEKILKEFREKYVHHNLPKTFNGHISPHEGQLRGIKADEVLSFISSALDTYGKEQREGGELEGWNGAQEVAASKYYPAIKEARAQALDEAIAAVKKWAKNDIEADELEKIISTLNALRKKC